jgi:hypothetical protein
MNTVETLQAQLKAARAIEKAHTEALKMNAKVDKERAKAETFARVILGKQQRAAERQAKRSAKQAHEERVFEIRSRVKELGFTVKELKDAVRGLEEEQRTVA